MTDDGMADCIFCRIGSGEIDADVVHEDEHAVVIRDIDPKAPTHLLALPRRHVRSMDEAADDPELVGHVMRAARDAARAEGLKDDGYRLVTNVGEHGGQTVPHLHVHVLGGRHMKWPPG